MKLQKRYELMIFDADDTLRRSISGRYPFASAADDWELLPDVIPVLESVEWFGNRRPDGVKYGIASNQPGIAYGQVDEETAAKLLFDMFRAAFGFEPVPDVLRWCPHPREGSCDCRKPRTVMFEAIADYWNIAPSKTLYVGDRKTDGEAAANFGCDFLYRDDFFRT